MVKYIHFSFILFNLIKLGILKMHFHFQNAKQGRRAAVVETVPPSPAVDIEQDDDLSTPVKQNVTVK